MNDMDQNSEDTPLPTDRRPLGYWLRVVDGLLTREFAAALAAEGISRRDWMLLNVISGDVDAPELRERLARKGKRLRGLEERDWVVQQGDGTWALTETGRAEKARVGGIVDGIRSRVVDAIGPEAYAAMTASLESIARELDWDESVSDQGGFGGFGRPGFGRPGFGGFGRSGFGPGFRPGFGPGFRPRPFDPDIHDGIGRNRHRGFAPGRPGHPAERFDEPFSDHADDGDGCHGHPHAHHHGHPHHGHGHGDDHGHGEHRGGGGHGHGAGGHGHHGHGGHGRRAQRAYERGFDAGFTRGREAGAA